MVVVDDEFVSFAAPDLPQSTLVVFLLCAVNLIVFLGLYFSGKKDNSGSGVADGSAGINETIDMVAAVSKHVDALEFTRDSVLALTREFLTFSLILLYVWTCENKPYFAHEQKDHIPDFFWFICFMILMFALGSLEDHPKVNDIVNRDQTEEWKGWMQTVFLLYHYFHAEEVYNVVRVMISCYVWMTGFGNLSFFYIKRDFGFVRFVQMIWRLNFSVVFLCLLMNNMYMLYYICPLHTFYFLLTFVSMRVFKRYNHTRWGLRIKLLVVGLIIFVIWEFGAVFDLAFFFLSNDPHPGAAVGAYGIKYEWHFRSGLDHYSTFFGMIFALNFPQAAMWISKVESLPRAQELAVKACTGAVLLTIFLWWAMEILPLPKLQFNQHNPYTFMIPLLTYIFFRNSTRWLRQVHLGLLAVIGKYTLETYLMQHHIWLTSNAKTVLVFVPGFPKVNLVLVTFVYFWVARRLYRVTMVSRAMLIPDEPARAMYFLGVQAAILGLAGILASLLQFVQAPWLVVIIVAIGCGVGALFVVKSQINTTSNAKQHISPTRPATQRKTWREAVIIALIGFCVCVTGVSFGPWLVPTGAPLNAGPLRPLAAVASPKRCLQHLSEGYWLDLSKKVCGSQTGPACGAESWAWANHLKEKACRFTRLDPYAAVETVLNRRIAFLGDETTYDLLCAVHSIMDSSAGCRVLGSLPKPFEEHIKINLEWLAEDMKGELIFRYVPTAVELDAALTAALKEEPDVVVLGSWIKDALQVQGWSGVSQVQTAWENISKQAQQVTGEKGISIMLIMPPTIAETKLMDVGSKLSVSAVTSVADAIRTASGMEANKNRPATEGHDNGPYTFVLSMRELTKGRAADSIDGMRYASATNQVAAQLLLNAVRQAKAPAKHDPRPASSGVTAKKGSGGGVAQNPFFGLVAILVAATMIFLMDVYGGISFLMLRAIPPFSSAITWDESVRELHQKIGVVQRFDSVANGSEMEEVELVHGPDAEDLPPSTAVR